MRRPMASALACMPSAFTALRVANPAAVDSVLEVCDLFRAGNPPHIVPDESQATYERRCLKKHAAIDWNKPDTLLVTRVRGGDPDDSRRVVVHATRLDRRFLASN